MTASNDNSEKKFRTFFENNLRKPGSDLNDVEYAKYCFRDIFERYNKVFENINSFEDHSFYKFMVSNWNLPITPADNSTPSGKPRSDISCDEIFCNYLKEVGTKTNREYFHFLFKFVMLFRECINKLKKNTDNPIEEFTQIQNAETVPDTCNDFIIDFMDPSDYYGLDTNELIEAIQHLCFWLYFNNFTTSRLTLLQ